MYSLAIIGAGASGLAAAISAKRKNENASIVLIEALPRVGKKILATGNGRCNLTNINASSCNYNPFATSIIEKYSPTKIIDFFESVGLKCISDSEGRVYPMSNTATSVLDCLRFEVERLGIEIICDTHVDSIKKIGESFLINNSIRAKKLVLSCGGKAAPSQGSDGSGYELLKALGHKITPVYPGLVQLTVKENVKMLKGVRVKAELRLMSGTNIIDNSIGELLFTDYGLSGIAVMDISRSVKNRKCTCVADILPSMSFAEIKKFLIERKIKNPNFSADNVLCGILPKKAGQFILKVCGLHTDAQMFKIKDDDINKICTAVKSLSFTVTGTNGFKNAQITVGGACLDEFNSDDLSSKLVKNLYCTGELLDIDAVCGGFNLQWAWASGLAVGYTCI